MMDLSSFKDEEFKKGLYKVRGKAMTHPKYETACDQVERGYPTEDDFAFFVGLLLWIVFMFIWPLPQVMQYMRFP